MPVKNGPVANGTATNEERFHFDPDDPDYVRDLQRPAVIKEDLNEMERRKRVNEVLGDSFRSQLEKVIDLNEKEKFDPMKTSDHMDVPKLKLADIISPRGQLAAAHLHGISSHSITPISDTRGDQSMSKTEKIARNKLCALYRLVDLFQWSQNIHNHITLRLPDREEILVNALGLLYHESTASSLVTVDLNGSIINPGTAKTGVSDETLQLHCAIHKARPDVRCVMHLQAAVVSAVASMKSGLLPLCQEALAVGPISYHTLADVLSSEHEQQAVVDALGNENKIVVVRPFGAFVCGSTVAETFSIAQNFVTASETQIILLRGDGFLVCGDTIEETMLNAHNIVNACENQVQAARAGLDNLIVPNESVLKRAAAASARRAHVSPSKDGQIQWKTGELEWEAWMRVLDQAGFRTGHVYRLASMRPSSSAMLQATTTSGGGSNTQTISARSDVETPPAAHGSGAIDETDADAAAARVAALRREQERVRWLNSPNCYQKVEFLESGTDYPKKITKWVPDDTAPSQSTPIKIMDAHQFSPLSHQITNPKEFREKQRAIKEQRRVGVTSAGPQSHVLDSGMTQEDLSRLNTEPVTSDRVVMIGTASKGIIDREFRHNVQVYKQMYAPNPFSGETDEDIQRYMDTVRQNQPHVMSASAHAGQMGGPDRTSSPVDAGADTISLMQAARDHRAFVDDVVVSGDAAVNTTQQNVDAGSTSHHQRTAFRVTDSADPAVASLPPMSTWFRRAKSERYARPRPKSHGADTSHTNGSGAKDDPHRISMASDDEKKKEKKKKKRGFFSFMKSKASDV